MKEFAVIYIVLSFAIGMGYTIRHYSRNRIAHNYMTLIAVLLWSMVCWPYVIYEWLRKT